jgi:UrcA family protein
MKIVSAALVAASLLVGSTGAFAKGQENVAVRVSTSGVNFADADSVNKFRQRVARQAELACNPGDRLNADLSPDFKCRKSMAATTEVRIAQLSGKSDSQMAIVE